MSYINKYRPQSFDEVVGHSGAVKALQKALKDGTARSFLFTGGSGFGKTTLARIVAHEAGCKAIDLLEVDAATNTGIDAMREVTAGLMYKPIGEGAIKAVIVDEAHALSKAAIQSLLKVLEEPPSHVYWFLCTTEGDRILKTIRTRCLSIDLKPVASEDLTALLEDVIEQEKLELPKGVLKLCVEEAAGSPRQALSNLAACADAEDLEEAEDLLGSATTSAEAVELMRALVRGASWGDVQGILRNLKDVDPESVRRMGMAYLNNVIMNAKREQDAGYALEILDAFSQPFYTPALLTLACGKVLLAK